MSNFPHLAPETVASLRLPLAERLRYIYTNRWIGYTTAETILAQLDLMLRIPKVRRNNLLLVAAPGNGKTTLLEEFRRRHPPLTDHPGDPSVPVIQLDMPPDASESRFWSAVLRAMSVSFRESDNASKKQSLALDCMRCLRLQALIIDEFHNALHGSIRDTRQFMAVLKNLMNALAIPVIVAGTKPAITALNTDAQLSTRFEAVGLPHWQLNTDFLRFLKTLERMLPLAEPSDLAGRDLAPLVHLLSEKTVGGISDLVVRAAHRSLERNQERITASTLKEAARVAPDMTAITSLGV
jgi:Bacterial TniB protein